MYERQERLIFERKKMFNQCGFCKMFIMKAPQQSGDALHTHDYYQVWYVLRGYCEHYVEGEQHIMKAGDAFILPQNMEHSTQIGEGGRVLCCEFSLDEVLLGVSDAYFKNLRDITHGMSFAMLFQKDIRDVRTCFCFSGETQQKIEALLIRMLKGYEEAEVLYEDFLQVQIIELLLLFAQEYLKSPDASPSEKLYQRYKSIVQDVLEYIDIHYDEQLTLESVCKMSMMSKTYFCYLFKLQTKKTFVEYLVDLRISKSMEMLSSTSRSITEISQDVGFQNSTHFARTFKKIKGITPREYRHKNQ